MPEFLNDAQSGTASNDDPTDYFVKINGVDVAEFHPDEVILNEPLTVNVPAIVGAETLATFQVSDADTTLEILNGTSSATSFLPWIKATHPTSTNNGLLVTANVADSGTNPIFVLDARKYLATTISVRTLFRFRNYTTTVLDILASGILQSAFGLLSSGGGIGYSTGAGGTVTQLTSRATTVILNKLCGNITMFSAAQLSDTITTFTLTNSFIAATDFIHIQHISATNGGAWAFSVVPSAGSCTITVRNISGASITEATPLRFSIIKGVTA